MARFNPLATTAASEHRPSRRPRHRLCSEELQLQHEILLLEHERQLLGLDTRRQSSHTSTLYAGVHRGRGSRTSPGGTLPSRASSTASKLFTTTTLLSLLPSRPHFPVKIPSSCSLPLVKRETVVRTSKITVKVTFTLLLWEALLQWMYVGCLHLLRHQILEVGFDDYDCDPRDWVCGLSWHAPLMGLLFTIRCSMNFLLIRRHNYELTALLREHASMRYLGVGMLLLVLFLHCSGLAYAKQDGFIFQERIYPIDEDPRLAVGLALPGKYEVSPVARKQA